MSYTIDLNDLKNVERLNEVYVSCDYDRALHNALKTKARSRTGISQLLINSAGQYQRKLDAELILKIDRVSYMFFALRNLPQFIQDSLNDNDDIVYISDKNIDTMVMAVDSSDYTKLDAVREEAKKGNYASVQMKINGSAALGMRVNKSAISKTKAVHKATAPAMPKFWHCTMPKKVVPPPVTKDDILALAAKVGNDPNPDQAEVVKLIRHAPLIRPDDLFMPDIQWMALVRAAIRGKNIKITGHAGAGKTKAAYALSEAFPTRSFYTFNLGSTQDPRATLIGSTHFGKNEKTGENETMFVPSPFVQAIQEENSIILLDEITRAHPEAGNILMTVLDEMQRYLRLDEAKQDSIIKVAKGVTFIATANVGREYTSTRIMDKALADRFIEFEMVMLDYDQEKSLLGMIFPDLHPDKIHAIANVAAQTREKYLSLDGELSNCVSTRQSIQFAELCNDGFKFTEAAKVSVENLFESDGTSTDERTMFKQIVQGHANVDNIDEYAENNDGDWDELDEGAIEDPIPPPPTSSTTNPINDQFDPVF